MRLSAEIWSLLWAVQVASIGAARSNKDGQQISYNQTVFEREAVVQPISGETLWYPTKTLAHRWNTPCFLTGGSIEALNGPHATVTLHLDYCSTHPINRCTVGEAVVHSASHAFLVLISCNLSLLVLVPSSGMGKGIVTELSAKGEIFMRSTYIGFGLASRGFHFFGVG